MGEQRVEGSWQVVESKDPSIRPGTSARLALSDDGLRLWIDGAASYEIPWSDATVKTASNGQTVVGTGHGTVWLNPRPGADPAAFAAAFANRRGAASIAPPRFPEFAAGSGQVLVLYGGDDDGSEVDAARLLATIGSDAEFRAGEGWRLVSMVGLPLRHAGQKLFGVEGSGYTTKAAIGCLYVRPEPPVSADR